MTAHHCIVAADFKSQINLKKKLESCLKALSDIEAFSKIKKAFEKLPKFKPFEKIFNIFNSFKI